MSYIRLVHWHESEAAERAKLLRAAGYRVNHKPLNGPEGLKSVRAHPPSAFVIDLSRLPSHGREIALALRESKTTRPVPLVFAEGEPEKLARIKALLPDATYTTWRRMPTALKQALAKPLKSQVVPSSRMAGYSGTPLPKKLGIKAGSTVSLIGAPGGFERTLGALPEGVGLRRRAAKADLILWFTRSRRELAGRVKMAGELAGAGGLWIIWPKRTSGVETDLSEPVVREVALAAGLVDYKVCAVDATWSGLRFARRRVP